MVQRPQYSRNLIQDRAHKTSSLSQSEGLDTLVVQTGAGVEEILLEEGASREVAVATGESTAGETGEPTSEPTGRRRRRRKEEETRR